MLTPCTLPHETNKIILDLFQLNSNKQQWLDLETFILICITVEQIIINKLLYIYFIKIHYLNNNNQYMNIKMCYFMQ